MSMSEAVHSVLDKYADFSGRATRAEYWFWVLAVILAGFGSGIVFGALSALSDAFAVLGAVVIGLASLLVLVPSWAVFVRRLHDVGRSGWWVLIAFIPFGSIVLFVFSVMDSVPANRWGPNPKATFA
jgi:uncharacterized membrane protein YhaH (DUF805 family)